MRVTLLLAALCAASPVLAQSSWVQSPVNGRWYRLTAPQGWLAAEAEAVREGGHLATIRSRDEHRWLVGQFGNRQMWIGLNDAALEGTFVWASGEPVTYTNWCAGQPDGGPGIDAVRLSASCGLAGGFDDDDGARLFGGLIERTTPPGSVFTPVGAGCAGSAGVPVLGARFGSVLRVDARFDLVATNLPAIPIAVPFGLLGFSDQHWDGYPLPFDLSGIGMTGCWLYNDIAQATLLYRDVSTASWSLRVPNMPVLAGVEAFFQVLVLDPGANAFGGVLTNGGRATIGL
jgi:hypothetical protein